ncbi:hypothetical protein WKI65_43885 [Streptomyces sp. MS1.AVA.3]|uniref:hypothetical protein n=1 Tax=Streptomyces decoyicus TaxID=249567 RepID=UPI0030BD7FAC
MKITRALATSAIGASVILGGTMAGPAQAADSTHGVRAASTTKCHTSTKTFDLPSKPDITMKATICAKYRGSWGGYRHYMTWLHKVSWDGSWFNPGTRFNDLYFSTRAEHGSDHRGTHEANDMRSEVNNNSSGSKTFKTGAYAYGVTYVTTKKKNWTADGYAVYDANNGKGTRTWQLHGTAAVS